MNSRQILLLYQKGLVNKELIKKYETKNDVSSFSNSLNTAVNMAWVADLFIVCWSLAICVFCTRGPGEHYVGIGISAIALLFFLFIRTGNLYWAKVVADIKDLDQSFVEYRLHQDLDELRQVADQILRELATALKEHEYKNGVDHPSTNLVRLDFKKRHAAFVKFDLCQENQGEYLRDPQPPVGMILPDRTQPSPAPAT